MTIALPILKIIKSMKCKGIKMIRFCKKEIIRKLQHHGILTAFKQKLLDMSDMWQNALNHNFFKVNCSEATAALWLQCFRPNKKRNLEGLGFLKYNKAHKSK